MYDAGVVVHWFAVCERTCTPSSHLTTVEMIAVALLLLHLLQPDVAIGQRKHADSAQCDGNERHGKLKVQGKQAQPWVWYEYVLRSHLKEVGAQLERVSVASYEVEEQNGQQAGYEYGYRASGGPAAKKATALKAHATAGSAASTYIELKMAALALCLSILSRATPASTAQGTASATDATTVASTPTHAGGLFADAARSDRVGAFVAWSRAHSSCQY